MEPLDLGRWIPNLRLAQPGLLVLLGLLPIWWWLLRRSRRQRGGLTFPHAGLLEGLPRSWRVRLQWLPDALRALALVLLIVALARPQSGRVTEKIKQQGVDIMLALDVSGSMRAEDMPPNRLEVAKVVIRRFIERLTTDRVGLVVFAGRSFTQCPLTTDYGVLVELLRDTHIGMVEFDGTAIGEALANCVYRFTAQDEAAPDQTVEETAASSAADSAEGSRVVVLLTDGYNNIGRITPREAAAMAKVKGIKVHCIGVGSLEGAPVPWYSQGRRIYLQNPDGTLLITRLDEPTLQDIAAITGGQYFRATNAQALDEIYARIAEMEKHDIQIERLLEHDEQFLLPMLLALAVLAVELWLRATSLRVTA